MTNLLNSGCILLNNINAVPITIIMRSKYLSKISRMPAIESWEPPLIHSQEENAQNCPHELSKEGDSCDQCSAVRFG